MGNTRVETPCLRNSDQLLWLILPVSGKQGSALISTRIIVMRKSDVTIFFFFFLLLCIIFPKCDLWKQRKSSRGWRIWSQIGAYLKVGKSFILILFLLINFYCCIVALHRCVAFFCTEAKWVSYMYTYISPPFWTSSPFRAPHSTKQSSLCYTECSH